MNKEDNRLLTTAEIAMGLSLIELILEKEQIKNIYQFYEKTMECNWSKVSKLVLSKCYFDLDERGNILEFHKIQPEDVWVRHIEDCEYARGKCGNKYIIVHL